MPLLLLLLVGVLLWMFLTFRSRMAVKHCIWRENRSKDDTRGRYYLCVYCGAVRREVGGPPRVCHKPEGLR